MHSLTPIEESAIGWEIAQGIQERGFYLLEQDRLNAVWPVDVLGPEGRLEWIHRFAGRYGWVVRTRQESVMFRKQETKMRIAALWRRLSGNSVAVNGQ